ncbi:MAG: polysaccharide biosynthesis protein [Bacilli bacterium]
MKKNSFVEGTFIATFALLIIKLLGAIYVIPFYSIIGEQGGALYSYAYNVYNIFLNISTAGLPIAMSKIISEYNAMGYFEAEHRAYKLGKNIILMLSIFAFLVLFLFAPQVSKLILGSLTGGNTIADVSFVIRSVSFCLLIIPFLSVTKGYLQGHKFISPSSNSQVIEQLVRIAVILFGSYAAINIFNTSVTTGVAVAVFGAFIGGVVAYTYLKIKIKNNKDKFPHLLPGVVDPVSSKDIIKKIIKYSIPLILVSTAIDIYTFTDMTLVLRGCYMLGYTAHESETISSIISSWGPKICMLINTVATGLSVSLIPHMTDASVNKDTKEQNKRFTQAIGILIGVAFPMTVGISILSYPMYTVFFGPSVYGSDILRVLVFTAFASSVLIVVNMALQSLNRFKIIFTCTGIGLLLNALLDIPAMIFFNFIGLDAFYGAIAATIIGYSVSIVIAFAYLKHDIGFKYKEVYLIIKKAIIPILGMVCILLLFNLFMPINSKNPFILILVILAYSLVGSIVYIFLGYKNGLLFDIIGKNYIDKFVNKIKHLGGKKC